MFDTKTIPEMEADLLRLGIPVSQLCKKASIAETTWGRWKRQEFNPSLGAWRKVSSAFDQIVKNEGRPS